MQALINEPITIFGDGSQTRSFCFVEDLIKGILLLMKSPNDFTGPVNLGNPQEFTISAVAKLILDLTGSRSTIVYKPLPSDDPTQRCPDIALAKEKLGWEPQVYLEEGLKKTITYFDLLLKKY